LQSIKRPTKPKKQFIKDRGLHMADRRSEWMYLTRRRRGRGRGRQSNRSQMSLISSSAYPLPGMPRVQRPHADSITSLEGQLSLIHNRRIKRPATKSQHTGTYESTVVRAAATEAAAASSSESWGILKKERSGSTKNEPHVRKRQNRTGSRSATGQRIADNSSMSDSMGSQNGSINLNVTLTTT